MEDLGSKMQVFANKFLFSSLKREVYALAYATKKEAASSNQYVYGAASNTIG
jgi:hypothetical protein